MLNKNVDVLAVSETKLDESFPPGQFDLQGYKRPYRLDVNDRSGGLLVYVNSDIPSRSINTFKFNSDLQIIPIELNLRKQKWLIIAIYRPPKLDLMYFLTAISEAYDFYLKDYDNIIFIGDFNAQPSSSSINDFLQENSLYCHMKEKTCFKSCDGTCIDLIISNKKQSLQYTGTFDTGLSDHHNLIYTMLKTQYIKLPPKKISYRQFSKFNEDAFLSDLNHYLNDEIDQYNEFEKIFDSILDKHAPLKTKFLRANNRQHLTKSVRKAIMKRTHLKNLANKTKSPEDIANYRKQRNLVVNLNRKAKKSFYKSINTLSKSKNFWSACKPLFSNKINAMSERILLVDNDKVISDDRDIATTFNNYFNTIADCLDTPSWNPTFSPKSNDLIQNILEKFDKHPSISSIKRKYPETECFEI